MPAGAYASGRQPAHNVVLVTSTSAGHPRFGRLLVDQGPAEALRAC